MVGRRALGGLSGSMGRGRAEAGGGKLGSGLLLPDVHSVLHIRVLTFFPALCLLPCPPPPAEFAPDIVIISAGFDAAEGDPIGGCHLTSQCFAHMAAQLQLVAPTVALLEGGYNLMATAAGTEAVVRVLLGERPPPLPAAEQQPCEYGMAAVAQVCCVARA